MAAKYKGEANHNREPIVFNKEEDYPGYRKADSEFAGGMSAEEARRQNSRTRFPYGTGNMGAITYGADTGRDAVNTLETPGPNPPEASPASTKQSRDR